MLTTLPALPMLCRPLQALAGQTFQSLAKVVAKQLGKEMAGQEDTLANWWVAGCYGGLVGGLADGGWLGG